MTEIIDDNKPKNSIAKELKELPQDEKPQDQFSKTIKEVKFSKDIKVKEYDPVKPSIGKETVSEEMNDSIDNPREKSWIIKRGQDGKIIVFIKREVDVKEIGQALSKEKLEEIRQALGKEVPYLFKLVDELPNEEQTQRSKMEKFKLLNNKDSANLKNLIKALKEKGISFDNDLKIFRRKASEQACGKDGNGRG